MSASRQPSVVRLLAGPVAGLLLLGGLLLPGSGRAEEPLAALLGPPLAGADLAGVRGGFAGNDGLRLSFGLERRLSLNGGPESRTVLYPAPQSISPSAFTGLLQNRLDHQHLQAMTLLEVRMSGFDPVALSRFESLQNAQTFNARR